MSGPEHDVLVLLLRESPALLVGLLRESAGIDVPAFSDVRVEDAQFTEVVSVPYRADLALTLRDATGNPLMGLVVEVQRSVDARKRFTWPLYLASLHAALERLTCLVVVALDREVARWAGEPIRTLIPSMTPVVLGPDAIPWVTTPGEAAPELAVLSAQAHAAEPGGERVVLAALAGLARLDDEHAKLYFDWIDSGLSEAVRKAVEAEMQARGYEYQSDFARKYVGQGRAEGEAKGRAEGEAKGRAEDVLKVLETRGIPVCEEERARVLSCTDLTVLGRWLTRAVTARDASEALDGA